MAAKNQSAIPMCHPLQPELYQFWDVEDLNNKNITVKTKGQTSVEMETLTASSVSQL